MRAQRAIPVLLVGCMLVACGSGSPSSSASAPAADPSSVPPSGPATSSPATRAESASAEPIPSDSLGAFDCELPVVEDATVALANISGVRVATHAGYDRVVFEFIDGLPEISLNRASPPFTHDASGMPIEVTGSSFLQLTMRGGTKQTAEGTSSYNGPTDFDPALPTLVDLVEGGDFEAQSTWYLGLTSEACVRVIRLTDDGPPRLVIDVER